MGPYVCEECTCNFAASPALLRHVRQTNHLYEWTCRADGCGMEGKLFVTRQEYMEHVSTSTAHENERSIVVAMSNIDGTLSSPLRSSPLQSRTSNAQETEMPAALITSDLWICREPCCRDHGKDYFRKSEYVRHARKVHHLNAIAINKALAQKLQPGPVLEAEQDAMRNLRCSAARCAIFGHSLYTTRAFFIHLETEEHRLGWSLDLGNALIESKSMLGEGIEEDNLTCVKEGCPSFGLAFSSMASLRRHASTVGHYSATLYTNQTVSSQTRKELYEEQMAVVSDDEPICMKEDCPRSGSIYSSKYKFGIHLQSAMHDSANTPLDLIPSQSFYREEDDGIKDGNFKSGEEADHESGTASKTTPGWTQLTQPNVDSFLAMDMDSVPIPKGNIPTTPTAGRKSFLLTPLDMSDEPILSSPTSPSLHRRQRTPKKLATQIKKTPSTGPKLVSTSPAAKS